MFGPLHRMNPLRLDWIDRTCGGLAGKRVVDVGCGGGILTEVDGRCAARVTLGIDLGEKALGVARLHKLESGVAVDYRLVAAEALAAEMPGAFDVVTCMELLEHVPDPASIVAACAELARPGGVVIVSTINRNVKAYALAVDRGRVRAGTAAQGHARVREIPARPREVADLRARRRARPRGHHGHGLQPVHQRPSASSPDLGVNYIMAFRRSADG